MESQLEQGPNYTTMMRRLRELVLQYEHDPKHTITQEHILHRRACVLEYGGEVVAAFLRTVYAEILPTDPCIVFPSYVSQESRPTQELARKLRPVDARPVRHNKPPTLRRAARLRVGRAF